MKDLNYKLLVFLLVLVTDVNKASAQYLQEVGGKPFTVKTYTDIEGSPFLTDDWMKGNVKINTGQVFDSVNLKFNEYENKLYFKSKTGETLEFVDPVVEFTIDNPDATPKRFMNNVSGATDKSVYYQVISEGKILILKLSQKYVSEKKEFNSATVVKSFVDDTKYYLHTGEKLTPVKKDKKSILTAIGNKQPELEAYIKTNNLNLKNDDDLSKLIIYYNSL